MAGAFLVLVLGPRAVIGPERSGDPDLVAAVEAAVGDGRGYGSLSVARVTPDGVEFAGLGDVGGAAPDQDTRYELGSPTRAWTGMLLADAVERGEMDPAAPVSTYLPELAGTEAGAVTVERLATHTSGLPHHGEAWPQVAWAAAAGTDPFAERTVEEVLDVASRARAADPDAEPRYSYSDLDTALLGEAQVRATGAASWPALLEQRLLSPLGMTHTRIATDPDEAETSPHDADGAGVFASPHSVNGRQLRPAAGEGYAPAGTSTRTTVADAARVVSAILDGTAPGTDALVPRADGVDGPVGYGWLTAGTKEEPIRWHTGGTSGSRSLVAVEPGSGTGVVVLADSAGADVESVGHAALSPGTEQTGRPEDPIGGILLATAVLFLLATWWRALRPRDRLGLALAVLHGLLAAAILWLWVPWHGVPQWLLGGLLGAAAGGIGVAVAQMRAVPGWAPPSTARSVAAVLGIALVTAVLGGVLVILTSP